MSRSRLALLLAVLTGAAAVPALLPAQSGTAGRNYAFLVACSGYDVTELRKLPFTVREMAEFRDALLATGFDEGDIKFLRDGAPEPRFLPEKARIEKELNLLLKRVKPGDTLVVALNGHGLQFKGEKSGYFCPLDAVVTKRETLLPMDGLFAQLERCPATRKLLIVNACRNDPLSGQSQASNKVELVDRYEEVPAGIAAIYACGPGERSYYYDPEDERSKGRRRSLFMHHLIEAWRGRYAGGKAVTLEELFAAVEARTIRDADNLFGQVQQPQVKRRYDGKWVIVPAEKDAGIIAEMKFVHIAKGIFWMGGGKDSPPQQQVTIERDFELAAYCVTQGQWQEVMGNNPSTFSRRGSGKHQVASIPDAELARFPVENVSWEDAQAFIKKLNAREGGKGWVYRLPREAEWEYACRNAAKTKEECSFDFYLQTGTNDLSSTQANFNGDYPAGSGAKGPYLGRTTKVGSYRPNKLGLYDMHGNVWQWCEDVYENTGPGRVIRGGCWFDNGQSCRAARRNGSMPSDRSDYLGLRLARVRAGG